jgi:hypothetical protein
MSARAVADRWDRERWHALLEPSDIAPDTKNFGPPPRGRGQVCGRMERSPLRSLAPHMSDTASVQLPYGGQALVASGSQSLQCEWDAGLPTGPHPYLMDGCLRAVTGEVDHRDYFARR